MSKMNVTRKAQAKIFVCFFCFFFGVRSNFISLMNTRENTAFGVHSVK